MSGPSRSDLRTREIITPEGVPLRFEIASFPSRAVAFVLDILIIVGLMVFVVFGGLSAASLGGLGNRWVGGIGAVLGFLFVFFLMNFYFIVLEIRWHGRTVGKRAAGIRVIDRHGGELSGISVCARNFVRKVEFWLPLQIILGASYAYADVPTWLLPLCILWALVLLLFPLFNRSRLRLGDLIGGTLVVVEPRTRLLGDLVASRENEEEILEARFAFSAEQLEIYGNYELQVLEEVLRRRDADRETLELIAEKIKMKIAWPRAQWRVPTRRFLEDFYAAQRGRLEQKSLLGRRQERKRQD
jgi:uncharacterized RDD family membrane protein YckC